MEKQKLTYTPEQAAAKEVFCRRRGEYKWKSSSLWDDILLYDHKLISGYAEYSSLPFERGALSPVMCELIAIVIDSSITHLHEAGLRNHIGHAIEVGATEGQVLTALEIACTIGSRVFTEGFQVYAEELKSRGMYDKLAVKEENQEKKETRELYQYNGYDFWDEGHDEALALDPVGMRIFAGWNRAALTNDCVSQKDKELLWLALYASPTTVYVPGIKEHLKKAMDLGATHEEIISVFELISVIGVHSLTVSMPILKKQAQDFANGDMWNEKDRT